MKVVILAAVFAGVLAASAAAGPYLKGASATHARPGDRVVLRAGAGLPVGPLPLYLVPAARMSQPFRCSPNTICAPKAAAPPHGGAIPFRVPALAPGRYVYVLYCGPCYRGPGGSLIGFDTPLTVD